MSSPSTQALGESAIYPTKPTVSPNLHYYIDPKHANWGKNMAALIKEEALDEDGQLKKQSNPHHLHKHKHKQAKKTMQKADDSDKDSNFLTSSSGEE